MKRDLQPAGRVALLALAALSLVSGVLAGLERMAWDVPTAAAAGWHGALMTSTFFGAVISLERAAALGRGWAYLAPVGAGLAGAVLLAGAPLLISQILLVAAGAMLVAVSVQVLRRQAAPFTIVLALGAMCWWIGNLTWLAIGIVAAAVPWWLAFLALIIAGERLELTRFLPTPPVAQRFFMVIVVAMLLGALASLRFEDAGLRLFSGGLWALAAWLLRYDIARFNARQRGLTRYIAICLLCGYVWLLFAGALGAAGAFMPGHMWRDAALHAVGLGFVFSMVFGHAPIIVPALTRAKLAYHPVFYLPLLALHASLALRVIGCVDGNFFVRRAGGLANAVALSLFIVTMVASVVIGRHNASRRASALPDRNL